MTDRRAPLGSTANAPAAESGATDRLVMAMIGGISTLGVYPPQHPQSEDAVTRLASSVQAAMSARREEEISIAAIDQDIAVDGAPWKRTAPMRATLVRAFRRAGVDRLTFRHGCDEIEIRQLLLGLSARGPLEESAHLGLGQIRLADDDEKAAPSSIESIEHHYDKVMSWLAAFARDSAAAFEELDKALWELIDEASRGHRDFVLAPSLRADEERLFRHSIRVSLLATEIARRLGIRGDVLHEISLAALLHDVGYLDVPAELVWRKRSLEASEERVVRRHPELGAARLAGIESAPPLCVLAAYEHHLRWDGGGYPQRATSSGRKPHLVARLTAVADHWDALNNVGARLPEEQRHRLVLAGLKAQSGALLDPDLVRITTESLASPKDRGRARELPSGSPAEPTK